MAHTPDTLVEEKPYASESLSSTEPSSSTMPTLASSPSVDVDQAADMKRVDNPASPLAKDSFEDDKLESNMSSDEEERAKRMLRSPPSSHPKLILLTLCFYRTFGRERG